MKKYDIKMVDEPSFEGVERAYIDSATWIDNYRPVTYGQIVFVKNDGFYVKLTCEEKNPLARYKNFYDPVYTDSCMEFFADFQNGSSPLFFNCEINSFGTLLMGVGKDRNGRKKITDYTDEVPSVTVIKTDDSWSVILHLKLETIRAVYGEIEIDRGFCFKGNMYKCGDETKVEHYLSWNPITVEEPDFHRPDYFGDFEII